MYKTTMRVNCLGVVLFAAMAVAVLNGRAQSSVRLVKPVSFAILEDYDKGDDLAEVDKDFELFNELDIRTWRGSLGWDDYEPQRGRLEFAWLHRFAELAAKRGIQLRPYLGYTPEWAGRRGRDGDAWNDPPANFQRWSRFAAALARAMRVHPNVVSYEIYNEENVRQWWESTAQTYARTLLTASSAIRSSHASAILLGGLVFPDSDWIEMVCSVPGVGRSFDVLPFHAYPETWTPPGVSVESYLDGLQDFLEVADRTCGRKSIWINETGFATVPGRSERDQAAWWVRAVATFLSAPRIEHIGVYEIKDLAPERAAIGDAPNYHLGLTRTDRSKKLAFYTVDLLTDLLDVGSLEIADEEAIVMGPVATDSHMFRRPDGDRVLFLWTRTGSATVSVRLKTPGAAVIHYELDGRPSPYAGFDGTTIRDIALVAGEPRIFRVR
jgi:polysaccharide biosynthesis protein PslG